MVSDDKRIATRPKNSIQPGFVPASTRMQRVSWFRYWQTWVVIGSAVLTNLAQGIYRLF
jgi:hypothetical protein